MAAKTATRKPATAPAKRKATSDPLAKAAANYGLSPDLVVDLAAMVEKLNPTADYSATAIATGAKTLLTGKGYRVSQHLSTVRSVLAALVEVGLIERAGRRYRLAGQEQADKPAAKAPAKPRKVPAKNSDCGCGCGTKVAGTFAAGHDAKYASALIAAVEGGHLDPATALAAAALVSEAFRRKVERGIARLDPARADQIRATVAHVKAMTKTTRK